MEQSNLFVAVNVKNAEKGKGPAESAVKSGVLTALISSPPIGAGTQTSSLNPLIFA